MDLPERDRCTRLIATVIALICYVATIYICVHVVPISQLISHTFSAFNLITYAIICFVYIVFFIVSFRLLNKGERLTSRLMTSIGDLAGNLTAACVILIAVVLFALLFVNECTSYFVDELSGLIWHKLSVFFVVSMAICLVTFFLLCTFRYGVMFSTDPKTDNRLFWISTIIMAYTFGHIMFTPNLTYNWYSAYHADAVFNSVSNTLNGAPYSEMVTSIYGHYALFFLPFLKLARLCGIGNSMEVFALLVSGLIVIYILLNSYTLSVFIKNQFLKILGLFILLFPLVIRENVYLALVPLRILPVSVLVALIAYATKHMLHSRRLCAFGYAVCSLLVVWNTEMGFMALAAWASFFCCLCLQKSTIQAAKAIGLHFLLCAISFLAAIGIVELYNISVGGTLISVKTFLYPLFTGMGIGTYEAALPTKISVWPFALSLMLIFVTRGISSTRLCKRNSGVEIHSAAFLGIAVMGIGAMTYAMNRPAPMSFAVSQSVYALFLCSLVQDALPYIKEFHDKKSLRGISGSVAILASTGTVVLGVLFLLSTATVIQMGTWAEAMLPAKSSELWDTAKQIAAAVPDGTPAIGNNVTQLYAYLNRDTKMYTMDYSDMNIGDNMFKFADNLLYGANRQGLLIGTDSSNMHKSAALSGYMQFIGTHLLAGRWIVPSNSGYNVVYDYYVPVGEAPNVIDFTSNGNSNYFIMNGWRDQEETHRWAYREASLCFYLDEPKDIVMEAVCGFMSKNIIVHVMYNGEEVMTWDNGQSSVVTLPANLWSESKYQQIAFLTENAPEASNEEQVQTLSISFTQIDFTELNPPQQMEEITGK